MSRTVRKRRWGPDFHERLDVSRILRFCFVLLGSTLFCRAVRLHDAIHLMVEALHGHFNDTVEINGQPLHLFVYTVLQNSSRAETAYDYAQFQCRSQDFRQ